MTGNAWPINPIRKRFRRTRKKKKKLFIKKEKAEVKSKRRLTGKSCKIPTTNDEKQIVAGHRVGPSNCKVLLRAFITLQFIFYCTLWYTYTHIYMYIYSSDVGGDNNSTTLHVHIGLTPVTGGAALCVCVCVLHFKVG